MARTLSDELLAAQQGTQRKPAISIIINSVDYSSRILFIEHHEEPYRDWATVVLNNSDRGLDAIATADSNLLGYRFRIGYGYVIAGGGSEYEYAADLWVKSQQMISSEGQLVCQLYCEGQWMYLREQLLMARAEVAVLDPDLVEGDPYYVDTVQTKTVYELIEAILEDVFGWTLLAAPDPSDGILSSYKPIFTFERLPNAATVLEDLIAMTKCYLRAKASLSWEVVYPQSSDAVDRTFYSDQAPYFYEYSESLNLVIPNRIVVFAGNPDKLPVWPTPVIVGETPAYSGNYVEVLEPHLAPTITIPAEAKARAEAILVRYQSEQLAGYLIVPHDCGVELYDKIQIQDSRGA